MPTREVHIDDLVRESRERREAIEAEPTPVNAEPTPEPAEAPASELPRLSRDALKARSRRPTEKVIDLPDGEGSVKIRSLKLSERTRIELDSISPNPDGKGVVMDWGERTVLTILAGVIEPPYDIENAQDREVVEGFDDRLASTLFREIQALSKVGDEAREEAVSTFRSPGDGPTDD